MLSKSLIQFSFDGWGYVPSLLFDLRPNYGGGNEDNGDLLQKIPCMYCYTQCPQPCSRQPLTHASSGDSWTLPGKSWSVSCGVTAPFPGSWCAQGSDCALQETLKHSSVSVSMESLGPGAHKVCLNPLSVSGGNGV